VVDRLATRVDKITKAIIKVGYSCNNDCIFCHSYDLRKEKTLSTKRIIEKIKKAHRLGVKMILFSGGEPLITRDIAEIFRFASSLQMYSGLITNGRLLSNREFLHTLYTNGLRYVYMSFVSSRPDVNRMITKRDSLREQIQAILNIQRYKDIFLTINIPLVKQNIQEMVDTACKLSMMDIGRIKLSVIEPKGMALGYYERVVPPIALSSSTINTAIKEVEKLGPNTSIYHDGLPHCLSIDYKKYNRDLYSENILYMSESFEDKFYRVDYNNMDYVPDICNHCSVKRVCRGIYRGYIEHNDTPVVPVIRHKKAESIKPPVSLNKDRNYEVNIGKLCNNACIFCANGKVSKEEFSFVEYEKIESEIRKAHREGFRSLGFLGGEITIHPDVMRIVRTAKRLGFERIAFCTNGRRLSDMDFSKRLVGAGVTRFMISIHSHIEEVENYLNGRKNAYKEKIAGLKNLVELNRKNRIVHGISLNTCIHKLNYRNLIDFCIFFRQIGITDFRFNFIRPENRAEYDKNIIPTLTEIKDHIYKLIEWNEKEGDLSIAFGDIPFCLLPEELLSDIKLLKRYIGELRDLDTFVTTFKSRTDENFIDRFSWRERKSNYLKQKSTICSRCILDPICEGLFKSYINLYGIGEIRRPIRSLPQV